MQYEIGLTAPCGELSYEGETLRFTSSEAVENAFAEMSFSFPDWEKETYVFMPACAYNGNRFAQIESSYPPIYEEAQIGVNPLPVTTKIPALHPDGSGRMEVAVGDLSVPCVGLFAPEKKQAFFLFTEQQWQGRNIGFAVEWGRVVIELPVHRKECYRLCAPWQPSSDRGFSARAGEKISMRVRILTAECADLPAFFEIFFRNRKSVMRGAHAENLYTPALWQIMERHFNACNFSGEYYAEINLRWKCGWCGGGQSTLALLRAGNAISRARAVKTLDFMTSHISPSGFFYGMINKGEVIDDARGRPYLKHAHLVRRSADALYYLFDHFEIISPKKQWVDAAKCVSDAFARLYLRYGSFGQLVNDQSGEMLFGTTACGAIAIGALARASRYFGEDAYLQIAKDAGEKYYREFICTGLTYGGPGDVLCAPDSESGYAMVESLMALYEITGEEKWLSYAKDAAHLFSSWVVAYPYRFPEGSEFARLGINAVGSVFASVQNKHSSPGIATFAGKALYDLYRHTGDGEYLSLLRDIAFYIPQSVSTAARPIFSWPDKNAPSRPLPEGYICERVNTSDWEGEDRVGGVFCYSCWCESSLILTFSELFGNPKIRESLLSDGGK